MANPTKYVVITPVRDEEGYIEHTIRSLASQTIRPVEWIIVDDGSTDKTGAIVDGHARNHEWIKAIHRKDRGFRQAGSGVIEAFYAGYAALQARDWQYIVKLDGDLSFEQDYFEKCFESFQVNPKIGIGGGWVSSVIAGVLQAETHPRFHVRGATKIYKRECWDSIGGLLRAPGWDTLDEVKANMLGWETQSFPQLRVVQHRYTGAVDGGWRDSVKNGRANYVSGYHPLFMFLKCLKRTFQKPYFVGSVGLFYGFATGYTKRIPQVDDKDLVNYLRKEQLKRLFLRPSIWK